MLAKFFRLDMHKNMLYGPQTTGRRLFNQMKPKLIVFGRKIRSGVGQSEDNFASKRCLNNFKDRQRIPNGA